MSPRQRVLVVDGDADIRTVVQDLLGDGPFEVRPAANVDEALLELRQGGFDGMLCDLALLRARHDLLVSNARRLQPRIRIVATSASGERARSHEADASLVKPFGRVQLLETLRALLRAP